MVGPENRRLWLTRCQVSCIRSFGPEPQTLSLVDPSGNPSQWTLVLGNNGAGKSGLLTSLAVALQALYLTREHGYFDVNGVDFGGPWTNSDAPSRVAIEFEGEQSREIAFERVVGTTGISTRTELRSLAPFEHEPPFPPVFAYGPNRISSEDIRSLQESDWGIGHLLYLTNGLRSPSRLLTANRYQLQSGGTTIDFANVLSEALPDNITVSFEEPNVQANAFREPTAMFHTPTGPVTFAQLGYGYKTIVALVTDMASRLIELYPSSPNALQEPAICCIDELDLHLHPAWQRRLVDYLGKTFPKTQFVATAHSPLIVQAAERANLVLVHLSDPVEGQYRVSRIDNDIEQIRGWRLDQVVTSDIFGFESPYAPEIEAKVRKQDALRAQDELSEQDREALAELDRELERMPAGETYEKAQALMKLSEESIRLLEQSKRTSM